MPNYTQKLRLAQPLVGETEWGNTVNTGLTAMLEDALTGSSSVVLQDADYVLSVANGAPDEARRLFVDISGTVTAIRKVICPAIAKLFIVRNTCALSVIFTTPSGSGVELLPQASAILRCDGTNVFHAMNTVSGQSYAHSQSVASASWVIAHNLNKYPSVTITDSAGDQVEGEVRYNGLNSLTVSFSAPFAGKAYLN